MITTSLTPDQCKLVQNFITTANRRLADKGNLFGEFFSSIEFSTLKKRVYLLESRKILASGGYSFTNFNVPSAFNFGQNPNAFSPQ
jgi:hypothetical protein